MSSHSNKLARPKAFVKTLSLALTDSLKFVNDIVSAGMSSYKAKYFGMPKQERAQQQNTYIVNMTALLLILFIFCKLVGKKIHELRYSAKRRYPFFVDLPFKANKEFNHTKTQI
jgi:hypothetical protein